MISLCFDLGSSCIPLPASTESLGSVAPHLSALTSVPQLPANGDWHPPASVTLAPGGPGHLLLAELPPPTLQALIKPPWGELLSFGTAKAPSAMEQLETIVNAAKACVDWKRGHRKEGQDPPRFPAMLTVCGAWNAVAAASALEPGSNGKFTTPSAALHRDTNHPPEIG